MSSYPSAASVVNACVHSNFKTSMYNQSGLKDGSWEQLTQWICAEQCKINSNFTWYIRNTSVRMLQEGSTSFHFLSNLKKTAN